jgi:tetratricopeptide (TPR) repeat protein
VAVTSCYGQDLEQLQSRVSKASKEQKVEAYLDLADAYFQKYGLIDSFMVNMTKANRLARQLNDKKGIHRSSLGLSDGMSLVGRYKESTNLIDSLLSLGKSSPFEKAELLYALGFNCQMGNKNDQAMTHYKDALFELSKSNNSTLKAKIYTKLTGGYSRTI